MRCQGPMQRKRDNTQVFSMISTKSKTQVIDILDFKYRMVYRKVVFEVMHT